MSRRKGARFEREVANDLRARGVEARRGGHRQSQATDDAADVVETGIHYIEAKRCERLSVPAWLQKLVEDCPEGRVPTLVFKRNRDRAWAVVPWEWLADLIAEREGQE